MGKKKLSGFDYDKTPIPDEKRKRKRVEETTEEVQESKVVDVEGVDKQPSKKKKVINPKKIFKYEVGSLLNEAE